MLLLVPLFFSFSFWSFLDASPTSISTQTNLCIEEVFYLEKELREISGLTYYAEENQLLAINDEKALLYFIDVETGKVVQKRDFGKNADFEGIELVGNRVFITEHTGDLHSYKLGKDKAGKDWKTPLSASNDVEGLAYDAERDLLLFACKGEPALKGKKKRKKERAVYAWSVKDKEFIEEPVMQILDLDLLDFFERSTAATNMYPHTRKAYRARLKKFAPSGIAIHPSDGRTFLISSQGKLLLVYNSYGALEHIEFLHEGQYSQPEGICFSPEGALYISNEGRGLLAEIFHCKLTY